MPVRRTSPPPTDVVSRLLRSRRFHLFALAVLALLAAGMAWLLWPYWEVSGQFEDQPTAQPSRLYARPTVLRVDEAFRPADVVAELVAQGYVEGSAKEATRIPGSFHAGDGTLLIHLRRHPTRDGILDDQVLSVEHNGHRVTGLSLANRSLPSAQLEPVLLGRLLRGGSPGAPAGAHRRGAGGADLGGDGRRGREILPARRRCRCAASPAPPG